MIAGRRRKSIGLSLLIGAGLATAGPSFAEAPAPQVVVSIAPLHSLVASVMDGVGTPTLLIKGSASPHAYSMRPSEARALERADLVIWTGEGLEAFLAHPLEALAGRARILEVAELEGIELLEAREGGAWEAHAHEEDDAQDQDADHDHEGAHAHGHHDLHLWLDPRNVDPIVRATTERLSELDPANAERYRSNGAALLERIEMLEAELDALLAPARGKPYVVFHDAYHYFERRFGLTPAGSITVGAEGQIGARRINELRGRVLELGATCVFSEPQFEPALVATVVEGTGARTAVLDPLGADITPGPGAYVTLLGNLARSLTDCLAPSS